MSDIIVLGCLAVAVIIGIVVLLHGICGLVIRILPHHGCECREPFGGQKE